MSALSISMTPSPPLLNRLVTVVLLNSNFRVLEHGSEPAKSFCFQKLVLYEKLPLISRLCHLFFCFDVYFFFQRCFGKNGAVAISR